MAWIGLIIAVILFIVYWWSRSPSQKDLDNMARAAYPDYKQPIKRITRK